MTGATELRALDEDRRTCGRTSLMAERMVAGRIVNPRRRRNRRVASSWKHAIDGLLPLLAMAPAGAEHLLGEAAIRSTCNRFTPDDRGPEADHRGPTGRDRGEGRGLEAFARRARATLRARIIADASSVSPDVSAGRASSLIAEDKTLTDALTAISRSRAIRHASGYRKVGHPIVDVIRGADEWTD